MDTPTQAGLQGRRVVVVGGTGSVGEGIVRAWLGAGAHVVVPTRTDARGEELRREIEGDSSDGSNRLSTVVADYSSFDGAAAMFAQVLADHGPVTDAVAAVGSWWTGPALAQTAATDFDEYFTRYATTHLAVARAVLPHLGPDGAYHVIVGGSALFPVPGSGIVSMQQAALLMMARVLQAEARGAHRVFAEVLGPVNSRRRPQHHPDFVDNEAVGHFTVALSADPRLAPTVHELLDRASLTAALDEVRMAGA